MGSDISSNHCRGVRSRGDRQNIPCKTYRQANSVMQDESRKHTAGSAYVVNAAACCTRLVLLRGSPAVGMLLRNSGSDTKLVTMN